MADEVPESQRLIDEKLLAQAGTFVSLIRFRRAASFPGADRSSPSARWLPEPKLQQSAPSICSTLSHLASSSRNDSEPASDRRDKLAFFVSILDLSLSFFSAQDLMYVNPPGSYQLNKIPSLDAVVKVDF